MKMYTRALTVIWHNCTSTYAQHNGRQPQLLEHTGAPTTSACASPACLIGPETPNSNTSTPTHTLHSYRGITRNIASYRASLRTQSTAMQVSHLHACEHQSSYITAAHSPQLQMHVSTQTTLIMGLTCMPERATSVCGLQTSHTAAGSAASSRPATGCWSGQP